MGFATSIGTLFSLLSGQRGEALATRRLDRSRLSVLQELLLAEPTNNSEIARMAEIDKNYRVGDIETFVRGGFAATKGTLTNDAVCVIILNTFYSFDSSGDRKINRREMNNILDYIGESSLSDQVVDMMMAKMDDLTPGDQLLQGPEFFFWFHWPEMDGVTNYPGNANNLENTIQKYKQEVDWGRTQEQAFYSARSLNVADRSRARASRTGPERCVNVNQTALRHAQEPGRPGDWGDEEWGEDPPGRRSPKGVIRPMSTRPSPAQIKSCFGALTEWREATKVNFFHTFFDFNWDFLLDREEMGIIYDMMYPGTADAVIDTVFANLDIQTVDGGISGQEFYLFFTPGFQKYEMSLLRRGPNMTGGNLSARHPCLE